MLQAALEIGRHELDPAVAVEDGSHCGTAGAQCGGQGAARECAGAVVARPRTAPDTVTFA